VQDPARAEVLIVNTCAFIEDAKKEAVDAILEMGRYKTAVGGKKGRCKKLIVAGCLPQRYKSSLAGLLPEVDLFIGTGEYQNIVKLIDGPPSPKEKKNGAGVVGVPRFIHSSATPRRLATPRHAVYIKIAEGCFHGCSFCIIPRLRGGFRSRRIDDVVGEAEALVAGGAKELNLIAQDTTSYGRDLKDGSDLTELLKRLEKIKGDFWIRVMYAYPTSITDGLLETMAASKKVCRYLDLPIQHICDPILKAMRRKEKGSDIRALVKKIRRMVPGMTLRTSLIVGFPGETARGFDELLEFVKEGHFDHLGVFTYSEEEGTSAAKLPCKVRHGTALRRRNGIMAAQMAVVEKRNGRLLGRTMKALVDGDGVCRLEGQAPDIDSVTLISEHARGRPPETGKFIKVRIVGVRSYDLIAEIF